MAHERDGNLLAAVEVWRATGKEENAVRLEAALFARNRNHDAAAETYQHAAMWGPAAEQFERAARYRDAAVAWEKANDHDRAGRAYRSAGDLRSAARCFELAQDWQRAGAAWAKVNEPQRFAVCLARLGHPFEAGVVMETAGRTYEAIRCFESVAPLSRPYERANLRLATLYETTQQPDKVGPALDRALGTAVPNEENADAFVRWIALLDAAGEKRAERMAARLIAAGHAPKSFETEWRPRIDKDELEGPGPRRFKSSDSGSREIPDEVAAWLAAAAPGFGDSSRRSSGIRRRTADARYQIKRTIATGGMGEVIEAYDRVLDRRVALKRLRPELFENEKARALLRSEARLACRLDHPSILRMYDLETEGHLQITMEYVDGQSLREVLSARGGRMGWRDVSRLIVPLCDALDYAHEAQVVHGDLKPDNVMLTREGVVKLVDFGIARALDVQREETMAVVGTPLYMSPEQITMEPIDGRADIYALGCMLFECVGGRPPFPAGDILRQHLTAPRPNVETVAPSLPRGLGAILQRAMARSPNDRYARASDLMAALQLLR